MIFTAKQNLASWSIRNESGTEVMLSSESKEQIISRLKSQFGTDDIEVKWPDEQASKETKYFTENDLKESLGDQGMQQLNAVTIDPGQNFMEGKATNTTTSPTPEAVVKGNGYSFKLTGINPSATSVPTANDINTNNATNNSSNSTSTTETAAKQKFTMKQTQQQLNNVVGSTIGATAMGLGLYDDATHVHEIIITLSAAIIQRSTKIITREATKLVTDYLTKHATAAMTFPQKINSYSMAYFNANKMSIGEALKSFNESAEDRAEKQQDEDNKKNKSKFLSNIQEKSQGFVNKMNNYVTTGTSYINMVTAYIQNGPSWVTHEIDKQIGKLIAGAKKEVDKQWEKDKNEYDEKARTIGEQIGAEMVAKFNNSLKDAQKKNTEKIRKTTTKVKITLFATLSKAASLLGSQLGIYIPVTMPQ